MVGPCGLEPQTSTVSKRRDYVLNNLESVGNRLSTWKRGEAGILTGEITGEKFAAIADNARCFAVRTPELVD
jgi:hypothetical protein